MTYGVTLGYFLEESFGALSDKGAAIFTQVKALGLSGVRINAYYGTWPVGNDGIIEAAAAAGLEIILTLNNYNASSVTVPQFANFASQVAGRYGPLGIHYYELLNEPNYCVYFNNTAGTTNPGEYVTLLKSVYPALKTADSSAVVLLGSPSAYGEYVAPTGAWNGTAWAGGSPPGQYASYNSTTGDYGGGFNGVNGVAWLQTIYAAGGKNYFDVVCCHPYSYAESPSLTTDPYNAWYQMYGAPVSTYSLMTANGDSSKPIWITEFGVNTPNTSPGTTNEWQRESLVTAVQLALANSSMIYRLYFFNLMDSGDGPWGFFDSSGNSKPALASVMATIGRPTHRYYSISGTRKRLKATPIVES